ncbi:MAG TPA: Holliday junction branch migration DNA helicase RuvB [Planctomycetes bacterium]|nr:Holliday junction branch migration DNA helicase RuvB [Planctomycetota bacterium]
MEKERHPPEMPLEGEHELDRALRPASLAEFTGQAELVANLKITIQAARERGEPLDHLLFCGQPGLGKTTLAWLLAKEMGSEIFVTSGPALASPKDLVGTLTRLGRGDILFVDEIHRLPRSVEEFLYSAMEDQAIDITIDQGPSARCLRLSLQPFSLVGATTREGMLAAPFRSRFGLVERLAPYPVEDLVCILHRAAQSLGIGLAEEAAVEMAGRSRGTPRIALRLLRRIRDRAQVQGEARIDLPRAREGLRALGIDAFGLERLDRELLMALIARGGGPVGLKTLAASIGESVETIETVYEPFLLRLGFLSRTPRGRVATRRAFEHLGQPVPSTFQTLAPKQKEGIQEEFDF